MSAEKTNVVWQRVDSSKQARNAQRLRSAARWKALLPVALYLAMMQTVGWSGETNRTDALYSVTSAKGDGKADDTAAIQADIAAMEAAGGGTLLLKSGTYKLTSTIRIRHSDIGIKGAGRSTVFQAVGDYGHVFDCRLDTDPTTWPGLAFVKFMDVHFDTPNDHKSGAVIYARFSHHFEAHSVTWGNLEEGANKAKFYDGLVLDKQDTCYVFNCQGIAKRRCFYSSGAGKYQYGAFSMNGLVRDSWFWCNASAADGSACVYLGPSNGGIVLDTVCGAFAQYGVYAEAGNGAMNINRVSMDSLGGDAFHFAGMAADSSGLEFYNCWAGSYGQHQKGARGLYVASGPIVVCTGFHLGILGSAGDAIGIEADNVGVLVIADPAFMAGDFAPATGIIVGPGVKEGRISGGVVSAKGTRIVNKSAGTTVDGGTPAGAARETAVTTREVANEAARLALTGLKALDLCKQTDTRHVWLVVDAANVANAAGWVDLGAYTVPAGGKDQGGQK